jgi:hypothetical protein
MAEEKAPHGEGRPIRTSDLTWVSLARIARIGLGGTIIGAIAGVYLGALVGLIPVLCGADLSLAFDGAVVGAAALAICGGGYGVILGVTEHAAAQPNVSQLTPGQGPPAGPRSPTCTPDMEHAHGR